MTNDRDDQLDREFGGILCGLEQIAQRFDAQQYPGEAWPGPAVKPHRPRRLMWRMAASLAAAAAILAIVAYNSMNSHIGPPEDEDALALAPVFSEDLDFEDLDNPQVVIVEDFESYSIIDLTTGVPLVSFATKDSFSPACVVPLLPERSPQATTSKKNS